MKSFATIDDYIASFPNEVQSKLREIRILIKKEAPEAREKISYGMPAFDLNGPLVYFAAFTKHIGFYPTASGVAQFKKDLSKYVMGKGSIQFPINEPLPLELIRQMVKFRVGENKRKK